MRQQVVHDLLHNLLLNSAEHMPTLVQLLRRVGFQGFSQLEHLRAIPVSDIDLARRPELDVRVLVRVCECSVIKMGTKRTVILPRS